MISGDQSNRGAELLGEGRLSEAIECFERSLAEHPDDVVARNNAANALQVAGRLDEALAHYRQALQRARPPLSFRIASNYLTTLSYHPGISDAQLRAETQRIAAGFGSPRPMAPAGRADRPLRLGLVSADLCDHPVGFFLAPVLAALDRTKFDVRLYSTGGREDSTRQVLRALAAWSDVAGDDHDQLLTLLRADGNDILIDLSGHSAGNRLPVFARRAALVQLSWLGYFATTGLPAMDGVILDPWHAPDGTESQFTERLLRLPATRFCYAPAAFAPAPSPPPVLARGAVTFGSFNNTAKLNGQVVAAWARVLLAVAGSRLILRWATFADAAFAESIRRQFAAHGVAADRLILRGRIGHRQLLDAYAEIDIALDPFPFAGGHTSCEALWMGVPVVTLPGTRPVSRQTYCFLANIGLTELAATDEADYVAKAVRLAGDAPRLAELRQSLRSRMAASPLMDAAAFARAFEALLAEAWGDVAGRTAKTVLHVGPGQRDDVADLPAVFLAGGWTEIRLGIDPATPDIAGALHELTAVADGSMDAVYASHTIEHFAAHQVGTVLGQFRRVLRREGILVLTCPDLQALGTYLSEDKLVEAVGESPAGPITPLDILYGHRPALAAGNDAMAHKSGFTLTLLIATLREAGFAAVAGRRRPGQFDLWAVASAEALDDAAIRAVADRFLPV
jgi:predicted O-linked N-acetylglucosamine transferase (SPINDLY family)